MCFWNGKVSSPTLLTTTVEGLLWAGENGYEDGMKILLRRDRVTPDTADKCGRTPLSWAAGGGYEDAIEVLWGREGILGIFVSSIERCWHKVFHRFSSRRDKATEGRKASAILCCC